MAQRTIIELIDDIDGTEATETIPFALDGQSYEIDLSKVNAEKLRNAIEPFGVAARKVKSTPTKKSNGSGVSPKRIREWALANGVDVPARGRIPQTVREKYDAAQATK